MRRVLILLLVLLGAGFFGFYFSKKKIEFVREKRTHQSYFTQLDFYERAFKNNLPEIQRKSFKAVVVNHHLLAPDVLLKGLYAVLIDSPRRVYIVSPNHFGTGRGRIVSSGLAWETPYGVLDADVDEVMRLEQLGVVKVESDVLDGEHGVSSLTAFIKSISPTSKIVPLVIRQNVHVEDLRELLANLDTVQSVVVASVDFSHYMDTEKTRINDENVIISLQAFDKQRLLRAEVDSPQSLWVMIGFCEKLGDTKFEIFAHSSTLERFPNANPSDNTSWVSGGCYN